MRSKRDSRVRLAIEAFGGNGGWCRSMAGVPMLSLRAKEGRWVIKVACGVCAGTWCQAIWGRARDAKQARLSEQRRACVRLTNTTATSASTAGHGRHGTRNALMANPFL